MNDRTIIRSMLLLTLTVGGIMFYMAFHLRSQARNAPAESELAILEGDENPYSQFHIPDFELIDRHGNPITHEVLDGQYTVVDFFFTSCPLWCPGMTQAMRKVQLATEGSSLRFMSISIDGLVDSPEAIDEYAAQYQCDPERWSYATGDPSIVASLVMDGLKFDLGDPSDTEDSGRLINHPTRLILLGPDRRVIGLYRYNDSEEVDQLIADAKSLVN